MAMNCPSCKTVSMNSIDFNGEEVDTCPKCRGLWFDSGELNGALKTSNSESKFTKIEHTFGKVLGASKRSCEKCNCQLERRHLLDEYQIEIDVCPSCSGIWIDEEEKNKVAHSPEIKAALTDLNGKVNSASWIFQFLTAMPVEYNVKPKSTPIVTYSLIITNILIFFYGLTQADPSMIFDQYSLIPERFLHGENSWSIISYMFLHGGFLHIGMNMYFLYIIGDNLEDVLGKAKFLILYILAGIAAGLVYAISNSLSEVYMVGASGAISALFAMYLLWFRHASLSFMFILYQKKLTPQTFFIIWVVMNVLGMMIGDESVAYMAHLGGFAAGLFIGLILKSHIMRNNPVLEILQSDAIKISR